MKKSKIKLLTLTAIFTALISASAWISIFTPFGINLTLQMFAVCLAGFCLGAKWGAVAVIAYIAIGGIGLPIFSQFSGGFGVLFGVSGGFLWGFLFTTILCGIASKLKKKFFKRLFMILSVLICHIAGVIQFCVVSGNNIWVTFISASLPFLFKDLILVFLANFVAKKIRI